MNSFFKKVRIYHYFWIVSISILIIGFSRSEETFDINIHDTYFVIASIHLAYLLSISYLLLGLGYWLVVKILKRNLIKILTIIHSAILLGSFIIYWIIIFYYQIRPKREFPLFDDYDVINQTLLISFILIVFVAQPIYMINLLVSIFKKRKAFS